MEYVSLASLASQERSKHSRKIGKAKKSITISKSTYCNNQTQVAYAFPKSLLKRVGLDVGDRVDIVFDPKNLIGCLTHRAEGGYRLAANGDTQARFRVSAFAGTPIPSRKEKIHQYKVDRGCILFKYPKSVTI